MYCQVVREGFGEQHNLSVPRLRLLRGSIDIISDKDFDEMSDSLLTIVGLVFRVFRAAILSSPASVSIRQLEAQQNV